MKQHTSPSSEPRFPEGLERQLSGNLPIPSILQEMGKILASSTFAQAPRLSRFLRYTLEQQLQGLGDKLKEYPLGTAVFDKDETFDPRTDPIVRVEAGRLRTKLHEYYAAEGRSDPIVIDLPKGSYIPLVRERCPASLNAGDTPTLPVPDRWRVLAITLALLLISVTTSWIIWEFRQNRIQSSRVEYAKPQLPDPAFLPIWKPFLGKGSKNFAVFGSPIFFANPKHNLFVRPHQINDAANLSADRQLILLQERLGALIGPRYDYTLLRDAIALQRLTAFLVGSGTTLSATAAHEAVWDSIKDGNIIFLGAPRMNPLMRHLPVRQDFEWDADQNVRNRNPSPHEQPLYTTPSHENEVSYAVVASFPGLHPDCEILMLAAHGGPGTQAAVDYLTRVETVRTMNAMLQLSDKGERKHFQLLLRVFVDNGVPIKTEYITHHLVP